jgi:diguanylate cyclase (GGDEF)-like protein
MSVTKALTVSLQWTAFLKVLSLIGRCKTQAQEIGGQIARWLPFSRQACLTASLVATTLVTGMTKAGVLQRFELFAFDFLLQAKPALPADDRMLVVGITEADIRTYGWPLSDQLVASVLETLQAHNPRVVGLDVYRYPPRPPGRERLSAQLGQDNVVVIMNVGSNEVGTVPPPETVAWDQVGFNDLSIDPDGTLRRALLFVPHPSEQHFYSFGLRVALRYLADANPAPDTPLFDYEDQTLWLGSHAIPRLRPNSGGYQTIDNAGYQTLLRFRARHDPAPQVSIADVLAGDLSRADVEGKVVLIGSVAPSLKDEFYSPYSAAEQGPFTLSGVTAHAQIVSQLIDQGSGTPAIYRFLPGWGETVWVFVWALVTSVVMWRVQRLPYTMMATVGLIASLFVCIWAALAGLVWLPSIAPFVGALLAAGLLLGQKLVYQSNYDALTGLPGRNLFMICIEDALKKTNASHLKIIFLGINRFQMINKSLGHAAGDQVLLALAKRLQGTVDSFSGVARVGGDEFALLLNQSNEAQLRQTLDQVRETVEQPLIIGEHRLLPTVSIGLAANSDPHTLSPEDLLRDAHTAMYRAKALNERQHQIFSVQMRDEAIARLSLESDLLAALENGEFQLFYQPIIDLHTTALAGAEALLRWHHPTKGYISPSQFIPVLEETGLILQLGDWVINQACQQAKQWQKQFPQTPLKISINLSPQQFSQPDLPERVVQILTQHHLAAKYIQLEITESMVVTDADASGGLMARLKAQGICLAIDDFGTGYSSLSYLHKFPADTLKIDLSFVSRMDQSRQDRDIVQTIITLGHKLHMQIVAEGITTVAQIASLKAAGCQYGQGYFFAKPLSPTEFSTFIQGYGGSPEQRSGDSAD